MRKIICYDRADGHACGLMPLGNEWWIVTRDEKFESLDRSYIRYDEGSELMYLCEEGATLHVTDLTVMMGFALENAYDDIHEELDQRLNTLKEQGVMVSEEPRRLDLIMRLYDNAGTLRKGAYSMVCEDRHRADGCLLNLDNFDDADIAIHWGYVYADFFQRHGVDVHVTLCAKPAGIIGQLKEGVPVGWSIENE